MHCDNTAPELRPNESFSFDVVFMPKAQGQFNHELNIKTMLNPFENVVIDMRGEAFQDEILFDDLPGQSEDTMRFEDCWVNVEKTLNFQMLNNSKTWIRFTWPTKDTPN
mmetsp:Transcript_116279/g.249898  ORF Transcript_116279/g.249898 Transcript_116279/m.249898 type:complete len:109 (-) Transcript_116279:408-734(-)